MLARFAAALQRGQIQAVGGQGFGGGGGTIVIDDNCLVSHYFVVQVSRFDRILVPIGNSGCHAQRQSCKGVLISLWPTLCAFEMRPDRVDPADSSSLDS
jgi:hypothetical protein